MDKELYVITKGNFKGRKGHIDDSMLKKTGNVMFYTIEGKFPYRVCKKHTEMEKINE